ncbi:phosphoribosylglycinamide formyltransferase [Candidatus Peregrinibacteria bacterium]|jgi:phosphoribosylglycinamide formyltransferase 1|nr:phosphoribosylglycinamide formyltransferase [Candidatus Peregrinibacteria bacterium]
MEKPFNIIVLATGNGTNLGAIIDAKNEGHLQSVEILGVISNKSAVGALKKAEDYGCPAKFIGAANKTREEYDQELIDYICELEAQTNQKVDLICLIGYMRILSPKFIQQFPRKIINVHPALLPSYGGPGMLGDYIHEAVLANNDSETGMTIHYVDEGVDTGEIILQTRVPVELGDTVETLRHKVQSQEKLGYVKVLEDFSAAH